LCRKSSTNWRAHFVRVAAFAAPTSARLAIVAQTRNGSVAGNGGNSASEPTPNSRKHAAVLTRNAGRPRPPKRGSSAIKPRDMSVSTAESLSTPRMWRMSARVTGWL
jgi:hypothetical protein